jgi:hypothetical protein
VEAASATAGLSRQSRYGDVGSLSSIAGPPPRNPLAKAQREAKPEKQQDMLREMF